MPAIEHVVKLFTLTQEHGQVSAFDSHGSDVFVGTTRGYLLHLVVEGLQTSGASHADSLAPEPQATDTESTGLFTTLAQCTRATEHGAVSQLQHSRTQPIALVRCDAVLSVWRTDTLQCLHRVSADAGLFFLAPASGRPLPLPPRGPNMVPPSLAAVDPLGGAGTTHATAHTRTTSSVSDVSSLTATPLAEPQATTTPPGPSRAASVLSSLSSRRPWREGHSSAGAPDSLAPAPERVFIVPRTNPKLVSVMELNVSAALSSAAGDGSRRASSTSPTPALQTFELPEPVVALVAHRETLCVRTRRQCSVLSLRTGASRQVARFRNDDGTAHPALTVCADTAELCLGHRRTVLRGVDMDAPASGGALSSRTYSSSVVSDVSSVGAARELPPSGPPPARETLHNCYEAAEPVRVLVARHPHLFVFTEHACDVLSLVAPPAGSGKSAGSAAAVEKAPVTERLALPGILFSSPLARGDSVFLATRDTIWMMGVYPLRFQLAQLVSQGSIEEAFEVLQRRRRRVPSGELESVELELHILAGFAYLRRARPREAMIHLAHRVDPRDVLVHLPDCLPSPHHLSAEARRVCETAEARTEGYWSGWTGPCPYNPPAGQLQKEWLHAFDHCPVAPNSTIVNTPSLQTSSSSLVRLVPSAGPMTAAVFLETTWEWFKDATVLYLRSRLRDDGGLLTGSQRRTVSYALLVLMLERQDHRGAYQVVAHDPHLALEDAYDLLTALKEFRLLALLLFRKGRIQEAQHVVSTRVYARCVLRPGSSAPLPVPCRGTPLSAYAAACWARASSRAGLALKCLPESVRWTLARQLAMGTYRPCPSPQGIETLPTTPSDATQSWAALQAWYQHAVEALVTRQGRWLTAVPGDDDAAAPWLVFDRAERESVEEADTPATPATAPGSLREPFYLIDHMNLSALQQLLEEQPDLATLRDEEGATLLHAALSLLAVAFTAPSSSLPSSPAVAPSHEAQSALLELVLTAASILIDCGCPVNAVTLHAQTALDLVADATYTTGTACLDVVASALAAMASVKASVLDSQSS